MEVLIVIAAAVIGLAAYLRSRKGRSRRSPGSGGRRSADKH